MYWKLCLLVYNYKCSKLSTVSMTSLVPLMQYLVKPLNFKFVNEGDKSSFSNFRTVLHYLLYRETETCTVIITWNISGIYVITIRQFIICN